MFERIAPEQHDTIPEIPEPAENPRLVGHEEAGSALASAYRAGKLHHALLLAGPQGIGKATLAFHLAYHLLRHPDAAAAPAQLVPPDPGSALFRQIAGGQHPSLLYLTRPVNERTKGFKTALTVEEVRKVGRFLSMTAHDGGWRVVIVDPADDMNRHAANALLKSLEEPPARVLFILVAHAPGRLLPTIRSRCHMVRLQPLGLDALRDALAGLGVGGEGAGRADGSVRKALLAELYGGAEIATTLETLLSAPGLDVATAYRLAEAVSARDAAVQFAIFNDSLLERIAAEARSRLDAGDIHRGERLARLWQQVLAERLETETYNLDKKQHVVGLISRCRDAFAGKA